MCLYSSLLLKKVLTNEKDCSKITVENNNNLILDKIK